MKSNTFSVNVILCFILITIVPIRGQPCHGSCNPPECSCPRFEYPMDRHEIPQMVYFGFDDAVNVVMSSLYQRIFTPERVNPNGCRMPMTLYVSHQYTDYKRVKQFFDDGNEIAVHSVTHSNIDNDEILRKEAKQQKENLVKAGIPEEEIKGWRSPFLKTAGNNQPKILKELGYEYDISLTYGRQSMSLPKPWPFTINNGWPYRCGIRPCPTRARVKQFWEVPVVSLMDYKNSYPCSYVDGCAVRANNEEEAYKFLMTNFLSYYNTTRTPFGLNMHAAWFYTRYNLKAMIRFLDELMNFKDVYVVTVRQMLDWMKHPKPMSEIHNMKSWQCKESQRALEAMRSSSNNSAVKSTATTTTTTSTKPTTQTTTSTTTTITKGKLTTKKTPKIFNKLSKTTKNPKGIRKRFNNMRRRPFIRKRKPKNNRKTALAKRKPTTQKPKTITTKQPTTVPTTSTPTRKPSTETPTTSTRKPTTTTSKPTKKVQLSSLQSKASTTSTTTTATVQITPKWTKSKDSIRIQTIVKDQGKPSTTKFQPTISSSKSNNFNENTRRPWWDFWKSLTDSTKISTEQCIQNVNCKLPECFCQGNEIPNNMTASDIPQMVYITIDGDVNPSVYRRYRQLFREVKNPNGCPARGTVFVSDEGTYSFVLRRMEQVGAEIAMQGLNERHFGNAQIMEQEMKYQKRTLAKHGINQVKGWKTPELKALGNDQFRLLTNYGFTYDATLVNTLPKQGENHPWPFTLDYGYKGDCVIPTCPTKSFPGLWEIPGTPLLDYLKMYECFYVDGCMYNPPFANSTFGFLLENFNSHYKYNRSPFGIHLRQAWFSHPAYIPNIRGLLYFVAYLRKLPDVYLVSASDVITWMKDPTPIGEITKNRPWKC